MTAMPFKPVTREMACEALSISLGTLDALIADGTLPRPAALGHRRLLYWHPDEFYGVLDRALRRLAAAPSVAPESKVAPAVHTERTTGGNPERVKTQLVTKGSAADRARARNASRLEKLNS
jgi:predicted DNA-binding transcriptional regulator AlpA